MKEFKVIQKHEAIIPTFMFGTKGQLSSMVILRLYSEEKSKFIQNFYTKI